MAFTCDNEMEILGGTAEDRRAAAALALAAESVADDSAARREGLSSLALTFTSIDGLPESELQSIARQFPDLGLTLVYFSIDGEFYGYAKAGPAADAAESDDFAEDTRDLVARRYDGDRIAFVRAVYGLGQAAG